MDNQVTIAIMDELHKAIEDNDEAAIRALHCAFPDIGNATVTRHCHCGCENQETALSGIKNQTQSKDADGKTTFLMKTTPATMRLLIKLGIMSPTNINFLGDLMAGSECEDKWRFWDEVLPLFDVAAMREY